MEQLYKEAVAVSSQRVPCTPPHDAQDTFLHSLENRIRDAAKLGETSVPVFVHTPGDTSQLAKTIAPFQVEETSSPYYIRVTWQNALSLTSTTAN
jgi:hypothetical protein